MNPGRATFPFQPPDRSMPDLKPAYVFGPWVTPSDMPDFAYRSAPREDDRAEVWQHRPDDGAPPYWCGCWGGMMDAVELRDAKDIGEARTALDVLIGQAGHLLTPMFYPVPMLGLDEDDEALVDAMAADRMKDWTSRPLKTVPPTPKPRRGDLPFWFLYGSGFMVGSVVGASVLWSALTLLVTIPCCEAIWWVWRRASLVTTIVASMSQTADPLRWRGSRARMWLALFLFGRVANQHGQSVEFSDKTGETP